MKFTDSPVIDLPVLDKQLSVQQDNGTMHVGTSVWPCSLVLAKFAELWHPPSCAAPDNPYAQLLDFKDKSGVELGAGCGIAAMGLFLLGLKDIVVTDISPVMPALKHNLKRNKQVLGKSLKTAVLYWNKPDQISALGKRFDFVIATDVVYLEETVGPLISAMESLLKEHGVVLLGYQLRSPEAHRMFWDLCPEVFDAERVPQEHLHPEYGYEETSVYILRKKKKKNETS
ncbi:unnamed protein product [Cuscuta campestris]|uniref:Methyltransferase type 12 domain-containing protein n=1 Tax=Cuscuta campestris TaxID=132261 RepID=A0A484NKL9_9ASTE|nr:unnamed protein product [Cuscuta campestris]